MGKLRTASDTPPESFSLDDLVSVHEQGGEIAHQIAAAVRSAVLETATGEEQLYLDSIERRREHLVRSIDKLPTHDESGGTENVFIPGGRVGAISLSWSIPPVWGRILFHLIRNTKPATSIEMGSCAGVGTAYMAAACKLNGAGTCVSLEGDAGVAKVALASVAEVGAGAHCKITVGSFDKTFQSALETHQPIDLAFVDGDHSGELTVVYFDLLLKHAADSMIVVFDDIRWSPGMREAWSRIRRSPAVDCVFDLGRIGIVYVGPSRGKTYVTQYHVGNSQWTGQISQMDAFLGSLDPAARLAIVDNEVFRSYLQRADACIPLINENGAFSGNPEDGNAAVRALQKYEAAGNQWLLLTEPSFWWLWIYPEFDAYLLKNYELVESNPTFLAFRQKA